MSAERLLKSKSVYHYSGERISRETLRLLIPSGATVKEVGWSSQWHATEDELWPDEWRESHTVYSVETPDGGNLLFVASIR